MAKGRQYSPPRGTFEVTSREPCPGFGPSIREPHRLSGVKAAESHKKVQGVLHKVGLGELGLLNL